MRTEIALLQNVRVASPCHASWDDMTPIDHDRVRFCEGCQKRVYNLSAMGQAEAEGLLRGHEGHLCVRYYRRHDGTILTSDCPVGLRAARQLVLTRTRVSLGLCALLCVALAAYRAAPASRTMGGPAIDHKALPTTPQEPVIGTPIENLGPPAVKVEPLMGIIAVSRPEVEMGARKPRNIVDAELEKLHSGSANSSAEPAKHDP